MSHTFRVVAAFLALWLPVTGPAGANDSQAAGQQEALTPGFSARLQFIDYRWVEEREIPYGTKLLAYGDEPDGDVWYCYATVTESGVEIGFANGSPGWPDNSFPGLFLFLGNPNEGGPLADVEVEEANIDVKVVRTRYTATILIPAQDLEEGYARLKFVRAAR